MTLGKLFESLWVSFLHVQNEQNNNTRVIGRNEMLQQGQNTCLAQGRHPEVLEDFPGGGVVKKPPASAGDVGSVPGPGRFHMLCAPHLLTPGSRALKRQLVSPPAREPVLGKNRSRRDREELAQSHEDPAQPKINKVIF